MKVLSAALLVILILSASACGPKVNNPADVQAIKNLDSAWDKPFTAGNAEALVSDSYTNDVVRFVTNGAAITGKDANRASFQKYFDQFSNESHVVTQEVRVSGDLAVSRGTYETKTSLKTGGYSILDKGKWVNALARQPDGSWKVFWDIGTSDLPVTEALPMGEGEQALLGIERDWAAALPKTDLATLQKILANDWAVNMNGPILTKTQFLAELKSGAIKYESVTNANMRPVVFGDIAVVEGSDTEKSNFRGKDSSGTYHWIDVYAKRNGRWQCVASFGTKVG